MAAMGIAVGAAREGAGRGEMNSESREGRPDAARDDTAQLGKWERLGALLIGVAAVVAGAIAVFVSDNQAGTAGLFVIALAFLVIGTQGTPLIKFSSGEQTLELARKRLGQQLTEEAESAQSTDAANAYADAAAIVEGSWQETSFRSALEYQRDVFGALLHLYPGGLIEPMTLGRRFDFQFETDGITIAVEVKYRSRGQLSRTELLALADRAAGAGLPLLVITNATLSPGVAELSDKLSLGPMPVVVTKWTSHFANRDLQDAVLRLIALAKKDK